MTLSSGMTPENRARSAVRCPLQARLDRGASLAWTFGGFDPGGGAANLVVGAVEHRTAMEAKGSAAAYEARL